MRKLTQRILWCAVYAPSVTWFIRLLFSRSER